ncbi:tail fiber assembly protein [Escherichia coli 2749250]|nr:tail fiber assembly protein [Escherichia coli 2749250]
MAFRMSEQPRTIKIYNLLAGTNEFIGEGDAYIPPHTGLPANSTDIAPQIFRWLCGCFQQ